MSSLFALFHDPLDTGRVKVIGVYSTRELAEAAMQRAKSLPGFQQDPDGFKIDEYEINRDHWPRGFVRL